MKDRLHRPAAIPTRILGRTDLRVTLFGLGGEGVLRTHDRSAAAAALIERALDEGVNYFDTAPAYASSQDYYGAVLGERRTEIVLASKTADRTRDGSLRLLDDSLRRLRTDHLDVWQLHDLRMLEEVDRIFSPAGAIQAMLRAREEGRVRFLGLTGHYDPLVLLEAMRRFDFDTLLVALNAADVHRGSFVRQLLPAAASRQVGVIGMKVYAAGDLIASPGLCSPSEAFGYTLSLEHVSCAVIGCSTPAEVTENAELARQFRPFGPEQMRSLEARTRTDQARLTQYKKARGLVA